MHRAALFSWGLPVIEAHPICTVEVESLHTPEERIFCSLLCTIVLSYAKHKWTMGGLFGSERIHQG